MDALQLEIVNSKLPQHLSLVFKMLRSLWNIRKLIKNVTNGTLKLVFPLGMIFAYPKKKKKILNYSLRGKDQLCFLPLNEV